MEFKSTRRVDAFEAEALRRTVEASEMPYVVEIWREGDAQPESISGFERELHAGYLFDAVVTVLANGRHAIVRHREQILQDSRKLLPVPARFDPYYGDAIIPF